MIHWPNCLGISPNKPAANGNILCTKCDAWFEAAQFAPVKTG